MNKQALPEIGECVIATYRCGGPRVFHGFLSLEEDGDRVVSELLASTVEPVSPAVAVQ